ncbi:ribosome small subunit-dependent GTPase A [Deinococcus budaensis]|uniref:Small ribosomal subunit biogenesis GTPase RsgA n=1 Tax=Deinococcus budaensis TaxID=1665626 RepID=A0A7W8GE96_9DEIO|nr:ribosome small subunit-dependent GTPase A [Deinococcus budaensis]MBB5233965.1 ribosome biogenesis GTPase [Deinococcus budaensis]
MSLSLEALGWSPFFAQAAQAFVEAAAPGDRPRLEVGRVVGVERAAYGVWTAAGPAGAVLAGTLRQGRADEPSAPVIGDWLVLERLPGEPTLRIVQVLPRRTTFARAVKGGAAEQVIAVNVDLVFIVTAPDEDFDLERLGRYVAAVQASGARPAVLLNKADLAEDRAPYLEQLRSLAPDLPVHEVAAAQQRGLEALRPYFREGVTVALIGSSGVGKSTLTNRLLGREVAATGEVRAGDHQGRHTTTARSLYPVPGGGLLIDNPGLRDIAVWDAGAAGAGWEEIEALATECRFRKCTHTTEPGCAVRRAVERGQITAAFLKGYQQAQGRAPRPARKR